MTTQTTREPLNQAPLPAWWEFHQNEVSIPDSFETYATRVGSIAWLLRNVDENDLEDIHQLGRMLEDYSTEAKALLSYNPAEVS